MDAAASLNGDSPQGAIGIVGGGQLAAAHDADGPLRGIPVQRRCRVHGPSRAMNQCRIQAGVLSPATAKRTRLSSSTITNSARPTVQA